MRSLVVAFFACFTPWIWIKAGDDEGSITAMPWGFSLWWGSLCMTLILITTLVAFVDLALPKYVAVQRAARWFYVFGPLSCIVLPVLGYLMAWAGSGLIEPLQFLFDIRHTIKLSVVPVGLLVVIFTGLVGLKCAREIWKETTPSLVNRSPESEYVPKANPS